jgi:hypothetical protein
LTHYPNIGPAFQIASAPIVTNLWVGSGDSIIPTQHAFGRNAAGELIHYYWSQKPSWGAENLTQYPEIGPAFQIASAPTVINLQVDNNRTSMQHAFGRNEAGELIHYYWSRHPGWVAENLTQYPSIGPAFQIASEPRVSDLYIYDRYGDVTTAALHVFGRNAAGELIHYYWSEQAGWEGAENLTQYPNIGPAFQIASEPSIINRDTLGLQPSQHAFGRNAPGELIHYYWSSQPGWAAENLTDYPNIGPAFQITSEPRAINF